MTNAWLHDDWIRRWIGDAVRLDVPRLRHEFETGKYRVLVVDGFLDARKAEAVASFVREEAALEPIYALRSGDRDHDRRGAHVNGAAFDRADANDRYFRFSRATLPEAYSDHANDYLDFVIGASGDGFRSMLESLCGRPLGGVHWEAHVMSHGDFIDDHNDARDGRELGLAWYLSPDWPAEDGGVLEFCGEHGTLAVTPAFNRFVAFSVHDHRLHRVSPVTGTRPRVSMSGWAVR